MTTHEIRKKSLIFLIISLTVASVLGMVWFYSTKTYHIEIPIKAGPARTPYLSVEIQGKKYLLYLDLTSEDLLSFRKKTLETLSEKKFLKNDSWQDIFGNTYKSSYYLIQEMNIRGLPIADIVVKEYDETFLFNTTFSLSQKPAVVKNIVNKNQGSIGYPLLERVNLLLDYSSSTVFASNDLDKLKKIGYKFDRMTCVPFKLESKGIILQVDTDFGVGYLAINTSSAINQIRPSFVQDQESYKGLFDLPCVTSSKFIIGEDDFGIMDLYPLELNYESMGFDGFLGTAFLESHIVYIDYPNKVVYIEKSRL